MKVDTLGYSCFISKMGLCPVCRSIICVCCCLSLCAWSFLSNHQTDPFLLCAPWSISQCAVNGIAWPLLGGIVFSVGVCYHRH